MIITKRKEGLAHAAKTGEAAHVAGECPPLTREQPWQQQSSRCIGKHIRDSSALRRLRLRLLLLLLLLLVPPPSAGPCEGRPKTVPAADSLALALAAARTLAVKVSGAKKTRHAQKSDISPRIDQVEAYERRWWESTE